MISIVDLGCQMMTEISVCLTTTLMSLENGILGSLGILIMLDKMPLSTQKYFFFFFFVSSQKHMLWILTRSASVRHF